MSLVIPARNEAANIQRCVASAMTAAYAPLEIIVVDDHSTDDTAAIAMRAAAGDARVRVLTPDVLPPGWMGKQWACESGARAATGEIVGFLDADTWQTTDLVPRIVAAMQAREADLLTVAGTQEMGSFWETLVQPQVFAVLLARFGGTEVVNRATRAEHKIANGQCLFVRRAVYERLGTHAAVRARVAEDLALAQRFHAEGARAILILGLRQLHTRMYTSLRELVHGWGKNLFAGGREAMPFGGVGRTMFPLMLCVPPLVGLLPFLALVLGLLGLVSPGILLWGELSFTANLVWWMLVYLWLRRSPLYALLHPLGAAAFLYITLRAISRGSRVEWKGREYQSA